MSTRLKEKEERILAVLENLAEASAKGTIIVVEGKKDVKALHASGVTGTILTVKTGGKSFLNAVSEIEKLDASEVILLLDFDRRGREGTKRLKYSFERTRIKPNVKFWRELSTLVRKDIQCIESLTAYLKTLRTKVNAQNDRSEHSEIKC